jgi:hypothetical protein
MAKLFLTTSLLHHLTHLMKTLLSLLLQMTRLLQKFSSIIASIPEEMRELCLEVNAAAQG